MLQQLVLLSKEFPEVFGAEELLGFYHRWCTYNLGSLREGEDTGVESIAEVDTPTYLKEFGALNVVLRREFTTFVNTRIQKHLERLGCTDIIVPDGIFGSPIMIITSRLSEDGGPILPACGKLEAYTLDLGPERITEIGNWVDNLLLTKVDNKSIGFRDSWNQYSLKFFKGNTEKIEKAYRDPNVYITAYRSLAGDFEYHKLIRYEIKVCNPKVILIPSAFASCPDDVLEDKRVITGADREEVLEKMKELLK